MFKRLPAEVVARRSERGGGKKPQVQEKAPPSTAELDQVLQKRPDGRAKWLAKSLVQASDGRMDAQSLYSVVAHNRFIEDLNDKVGKKMYRALHANLHVFSSRQRKFLEKECALARKYAATAFQGIQKEGDGEEEKQEQAASAVEDMMARCRAFVRERQSERGERQENGGPEEDPGLPPEAEELTEAEPKVQIEVQTPPPVPAAVSKGASRSRSASPKEKVSKSKKKTPESSDRRSGKGESRSREHSRSERREKRKSRRSSASSGGRRSKKRRKDSASSDDRRKKKKR